MPALCVRKYATRIFARYSMCHSAKFDVWWGIKVGELPTYYFIFIWYVPCYYSIAQPWYTVSSSKNPSSLGKNRAFKVLSSFGTARAHTYSTQLKTMLLNSRLEVVGYYNRSLLYADFIEETDKRGQGLMRGGRDTDDSRKCLEYLNELPRRVTGKEAMEGKVWKKQHGFASDIISMRTVTCWDRLLWKLKDGVSQQRTERSVFRLPLQCIRST